MAAGLRNPFMSRSPLCAAALAVVLIAAITALVLYFHMGSATVAPVLDQAAALIKEDVADEAHRKQALAIVDQAETAVKTNAEQRAKAIEALAELTTRRAVPAAEIGRAAEPLIAGDRATAARLVDLRFQLKSVLTADEWANVFPTHSGADDKKRAASAARS